MKSMMRSTPSGIDARRDVDQHDGRRPAASACSPCAISVASPPSDAPTTAGLDGKLARDGDRSRGEGVDRVVGVGVPVAVAVAAQVERDRVPSLRAASAAAVPPQAWRVCPPPWSRSTGGLAGSP